MKTESTKRNGQFWKNVTIGGVPGILVGALGTGVVTSAATPVGNDEPVFDGLEPLSVAEVSDDMSFGEAFAAAREQVGSGGVFEWNGNVYNTYTAEEWNAMSSEDRAEFADRLEATPIDVVVNVSDDIVVEEQTEQVHTEEANVDPADEVESEIDVQIEEVGVVVMEDGSEVVAAIGQVDGHTAVMVDTDNDGVIDAMAVDVNDNDCLDNNEMVSVEDANLSVEDVILLADNSCAGDPTEEIYAGTPDYVNDADTSAFA